MVNVNPLYTPRELEHQLKDSGAKAIILLENFASVFQAVRSAVPTQTVVLAVRALSRRRPCSATPPPTSAVVAVDTVATVVVAITTATTSTTETSKFKTVYPFQIESSVRSK